MKKKIVSNFWLKIMAVLVSFLIWLMVINGDDPIKTETFRNVPITIKNADVFMEKVKKSTGRGRTIGQGRKRIRSPYM